MKYFDGVNKKLVNFPLIALNIDTEKEREEIKSYQVGQFE